MRKLKKRFLIIYQNNFLFEPITREAFFQLYVPLIKKKVDMSPSRFVVDANGKEVGFIFAFLSGAQAVIKTLAVMDEARGYVLSNVLIYEALRAARAKGASEMVAALVRSGAQSKSYARKSRVLWEHHYALFSKPVGEH